MRRLLVTGGAGFIGSNFVHYWLREYPGDRIVVLDALTYAGNLASLEPAQTHPTFSFVHGNICDTALVERLLMKDRLDTIVHFAAESHVDRSILGPDAFIETNVIGTHSLLKAARKIWLQQRRLDNHRFHHVSTDEVYGSLLPGEPAFSEESVYAPNSPYAASKASSDHLVRAYHHTYGLSVTTSNCSNNYGCYHFPEKLVPLMILNVLSGKPLPVYGDGTNVRDWLYVEDHCRGIDLILGRGKAGETYNIGARSEMENLQLVRTVCRFLDLAFEADPALRQRFSSSPCARNNPADSLVAFVEDRPGHDRRYAIDSSKAERELGFRPSVSLQEGLRQTVHWYLDNESWWQGVMGGSYGKWLDENYGRR